ncbi:MAG TPA: hypothetical protein DEG17_05760 [Cyanobacteria bacterium UBA11149]|nr:hypothetical protein [Cyanobacteria bacterium UBA11367]HBE58198.1 hypothetical protein [Cyanobacteria bacterium UBA11366]HBK66891.1 hypothetical protein [Cyanobacteria bacterium UBA11166]HBR73462.1 hypothetical protein [Cyanobacteria bacterium UBA11159]HBS71886.1 hypothetical protein [Cyanobacteria bacterium UBA11153]HBW88384.1 hypothetical protein [Cyanobacteria bacterium UBA11149]HCA95487.1 hypothetical protein [Cyanobacteria bacterium UBA9226]
MSIAKIKSWQKWQKYGNTIKCPKSWLTKIIYNSCMDVHRKKRREALLIENIDDIKSNDNSEIAAREESIPAILLSFDFILLSRATISRDCQTTGNL